MTRNILLVCPDRRLVADLAPLLSQQLPLTPIIDIGLYPNRRDLTDLLREKPVSLCFLDVSSDRDSALHVLADIVHLSQSTRVVVLLHADDPDLILTCLRQGASEFLLLPFTGEQLHPVLERLSQLGGYAGQKTGGAKVVAVLPVKGACGASTIASNLAVQLKKTGAKKLLLADLDPVTGTLSFLLKLKSSYSFMDAISRAGSLDSDLWKGMVSNYHGVDVLLSPENPMDATQELPDPTHIIEFCRHAYERVTLDLGTPYKAWTLRLLAAADEVVVVTTNELPALRATQRVMQHLDRNHIDRSKLRLVVNRYSPDLGLNQEAIETALHVDVFHLVPSDFESVQRALVEGKPIASTSPFGKAVGALADKLFGKKSADGKKKSSSWTTIFNSLVSRPS